MILGAGTDDRFAWHDARGDELIFALTNHQGSTVALVDEDQYRLPYESGGRFIYDAYGQTVKGASVGGYPYRYTGRRLDAQTGLYY